MEREFMLAASVETKVATADEEKRSGTEHPRRERCPVPCTTGGGWALLRKLGRFWR